MLQAIDSSSAEAGSSSAKHLAESVHSGNTTNPPQTGDVDLRKHPSGIIPKLQNVVSTCYVGRNLDLKFIAMHARNAEYNPKRFSAVIMRIREPKTTALIFSSGKMVCTGAKSESDSRLGARKFTRALQKLGFEDAKFQDFKVQNIVASCDVLFPIRLEGLHYRHGLFCSYEPELFPGLIYRMKKPRVVLLIFASGKVVLTGATDREQIYQAFETIYPALNEYCKGYRSKSAKDRSKAEKDPSKGQQQVHETNSKDQNGPKAQLIKAEWGPLQVPETHCNHQNDPRTQIIEAEWEHLPVQSQLHPVAKEQNQIGEYCFPPFVWHPALPRIVVPFPPGYAGIRPPTHGYTTLENQFLGPPSMP